MTDKAIIYRILDSNFYCRYDKMSLFITLVDKLTEKEIDMKGLYFIYLKLISEFIADTGENSIDIVGNWYDERMKSVEKTPEEQLKFDNIKRIFDKTTNFKKNRI